MTNAVQTLQGRNTPSKTIISQEVRWNAKQKQQHGELQYLTSLQNLNLRRPAH
jgi:hypothetical protein